MNYDLAMIYESMLITEMDDKVINYLQQHTDKLPFDFLFGDDLRIVIPISDVDMTAKEIMDDIKRIKDFDKVDLKKGEVIRKIKLDPKYGQGDSKEQRVNIGKVINSLKVDEIKRKKYSKWIARYKDNLDTALGGMMYSIILSRSPVDVVRMSDHRNISSCHSQGAEFFRCAVQEAISGGAVAYLVHNNDLDEHAENLQDDELFEDDDRGVGRNIRPISRIKVRRLINDTGHEIAMPEIKIYGDNTIPLFYKTIATFLHDKQPHIVADMKDGSLSLMGSSYEDSKTDKIVNNFMKIIGIDNVSSSNIHTNENDKKQEDGHPVFDFDKILIKITDTYNKDLKYSELYMEENDMGEWQPTLRVTIDLYSHGVDGSDGDSDSVVEFISQYIDEPWLFEPANPTTYQDGKISFILEYPSESKEDSINSKSKYISVLEKVLEFENNLDHMINKNGDFFNTFRDVLINSGVLSIQEKSFVDFFMLKYNF